MRLWFEAANGEVLNFSSHPFRLTEVTGIDRASAAVDARMAPGQDGVFVVGVSLEPREVGVSGVMTPSPTDTESIAQVRRRMAQALCPKAGVGLLCLEVAGKAYETEAVAVDAPEFPQTDVRRPHQRFHARFTCPDPFWKDRTDTQAQILYFAVMTQFLDSGIAFGEAGIELARYEWTDGRRIEVENPGDVDAPLCIVFTGPALNPRVQNRTTGQFIQILKDVRSNEVVRIDSGFGHKTVKIELGATSASGMQFLNLDSTFLSLEPGMNEIEFVDEAPGEGSVARVSFRARYAGV